MWLFRVAALMLALSVAALPAAAQYPPSYPPPPPGAVQYPPPPGAEAPAPAALYTPPQLDQMLAPVALYPDPLLTEILTAATYPLEVVAAAQWQQANAGIPPEALAPAVEAQGWDPSVESLTAFPQVLAMMGQQLTWTQAIGNAFLAQQGDVMDSIQRLRHDALAAGTLVSSPYAVVTQDGPYIEITPANPQLLYVPVYDPTSAYGAWPYPTYRPYYFGAPPGLSANFMAGALGFSIGIGIVDTLWNWGDWDWRNHDVRVNPARYAALAPGHAAPASTTWQHNPDHRRGVPYRDAKSRTAYQRPVAAAPPETRQQYRFYPEQSSAPAPAQRAAPQAPAQRAAPPAQAERTPAPQAQTQRAAPQRMAQPPQPPTTQVQPPTAHANPLQPPAARTAPVPAATQRPTAFQPVSRGPDVQAQAQRGAASRQSPPAPIAVARPAPPPAARPAPPAAAHPAPPPAAHPAPPAGHPAPANPQERKP
jgi:Protein of unknown function (DUF3300)